LLLPPLPPLLLPLLLPLLAELSLLLGEEGETILWTDSERGFTAT
jgi:hypothetical protein